MICQMCGNPTDEVYELRGYTGSLAVCSECFGPEDDYQGPDTIFGIPVVEEYQL